MRSKTYLLVLILTVLLLSCSKYYYKYYGSKEEAKYIINSFFVKSKINPMRNVGTSRKPVTDSLCSIMFYIGSYESRYDDAYEVFKNFKIDSLSIEIPELDKTISLNMNGKSPLKDGIFINFGNYVIPDVAEKIILKFTVVYDDKKGEGFKKDIVMELSKQTGYNRDWAPYMLD